VEQIMTTGLTVAVPNMETSAAAALMGRMQVRRLPVVEDGLLRGMVSLSDLAVRRETEPDAAEALAEISSNVSYR
jgi:signal-transduction protein with cAMP-binding, CBS, and nucleotidyltransferase domain